MKRHAAIRYASAFLIPASMLVLVMMYRNILPFGNTDFLLWDMDIQYKNIYCWFYDVLHGNASLFYDFSKSLGGNMYSVFGCYLASPINLLVYFFPPENMMYFLAIATVLKIALCGLTCSIYLKKRWSINNVWVVLTLATAYAMMEYNVSLCSNLHFLDSIYMLPLVALGVYHLVQKRKGILLWASISYCLFCNWYIGYMCCYFSIFYFLFELFLKKGTLKDNIDHVKLYIWYMILGVLGGSITFIPSALASMNGKGQLDLGALIKGFHNNIFTPLKGFYISSLGNVNYDEPAIYVGGVVCVLVIVYFLNIKIDMKEKIASGILLAFVFISFSFVPLEVMWTMLKRTHSFHFRYAFVFSFLMVLIAAACWKRIEREDILLRKRGIIVAAIVIAIWGILGNDFQKPLDIQANNIFLILLVLSMVLIYAYVNSNNKKSRSILMFFLLFGFIAEMFYNTNTAFKRYSHSSQQYKSYVQTMERVIGSVKDDDTSFYRMEKTISSLKTEKKPYPAAAAEALMFNYNGITHYSSFYDSKVDGLLAAMGYCKPDAMWSNYCDTNIVGDSILGIKYVITNKEPSFMEQIKTEILPFEAHLFKNPYALPFGVLVDENISNAPYTMDPFYNQELILSQMLGTKCKIYSEQKIDEKRHASEWEVEIEDAGAVYAYFMNDHNQSEVSLYIDGEYAQPYYSRAYKNIISLGMQEEGNRILLSFDENNCQMNHNLKVVTLDQQAFDTAIEKIRKSGFQPRVNRDDYVEGEYESESDVTMMLSIPYDIGWSVSINGKKAPYREVLNGMMAIDLRKGKSEIQLDYVPPFFNVGIILTCMGFLLLIITEIKAAKKRKE